MISHNYRMVRIQPTSVTLQKVERCSLDESNTLTWLHLPIIAVVINLLHVHRIISETSRQKVDIENSLITVNFQEHIMCLLLFCWIICNENIGIDFSVSRKCGLQNWSISYLPYIPNLTRKLCLSTFVCVLFLVCARYIFLSAISY